MLSSILLAVLLLVTLAVLVALEGKARTDVGGFPYRPARSLFTPAERSFLGVLDQAVGPDHRVFGKVRMADIANVSGGLRASARQAAFNRISAKHIDFVVCRSSDLAPVCAIELNDKSHASHKAQARDAWKASVCEAIGLPLLAVPARQGYSVQEVRERFQAVVPPATTPSPQLSNMPAEFKRRSYALTDRA